MDLLISECVGRSSEPHTVGVNLKIPAVFNVLLIEAPNILASPNLQTFENFEVNIS